MFGRSVLKEFANNINYGTWEPDTISFLIKKGCKVSEVQVSMNERETGESYLNVTKSIIYMLRMMISILIMQNFRRADRKGKEEKKCH